MYFSYWKALRVKQKTSKLMNLIFYSNALARSVRIRKGCEYLPEDSIKLRKAYFCHENEGYLNRKVAAVNPLAMMNPDMMSNMMKQNVQGMFNIFLFSVVGSFFSGFIIAQVPFPLG